MSCTINKRRKTIVVPIADVIVSFRGNEMLANNYSICKQLRRNGTYYPHILKNIAACGSVMIKGSPVGSNREARESLQFVIWILKGSLITNNHGFPRTINKALVILRNILVRSQGKYYCPWLILVADFFWNRLSCSFTGHPFLWWIKISPDLGKGVLWSNIEICFYSTMAEIMLLSIVNLTRIDPWCQGWLSCCRILHKFRQFEWPTLVGTSFSVVSHN